MKVSFTVVGSMLFAKSHAHMAMVEPRWNSGAADTSMCETEQKESAGTTSSLVDRSYALYQNTSDHVKAVAKCVWKEHRKAYWFNTGTQIGCPKVTGQVCGKGGTHSGPCCEHPMKPTLTSADLLSFPSDVNATSNHTFNPWFAPGYAPVIDPCGIVGGFQWDNPDLYYGGPETYGSEEPCADGCVINSASAPEDMQFKAGTMGSELFHKALKSPDAAKANGEQQPVTQWTAGGVAEVAQGSHVANHGGGYLWRLCPADEFSADSTKNEECFQRSPLEYATGKSFIQFGDHHRMRNKTGGSRVEFDAVRATDANTDGVMPKDATWTKFPVPNCGDDEFLCTQPSYLHGKPLDLNFPAPAEGAYGFGVAEVITGAKFFSGADADEVLDVVRETEDHFDFTVVDIVKVPKKEGRYVLSWRWDSEHTPQVWSNCALVDIVRGDKNTPGRSLRGAVRD